MDFFEQSEIEADVRRISEILDSRIFSAPNARNVLFRSAFIDVLICLRDLMAKCRKHAEPIRFVDDVLVTDKVKHVSDLVKYVRDAMCHPDSDDHFIEPGQIRSSFNFAFGPGVVLETAECVLRSDYTDEVAFFFGRQRIYLNRHIVRAFNEAKEKLLPLIEAERAAQRAPRPD